MPCGAVFENTTGITKRNIKEYSELELAALIGHRKDLELQFELLAEKKGGKIFPHQTKIAKDIVTGYNDGGIIHTIAVSPTQSGKTGIICETIRQFVKETNISYKNIYIITGLSSVEWKKQTKDRLPDMLKKRVFHRCDLNDNFYRDIERKRNILIILDEIQIASAKNQTIHKVFDSLNFMNLQTLLKKDVKFLEITATPNGCIYDLMKWGPEFSRKIIIEPPEPYVSCFKLLDEGRVKQFKDLCDDIIVNKVKVNAVDNVRELKETIDEYYDNEPRFHFIRTKAAESQEKTKNNFKEIFGEDVKIIEFDMENKEDDINNIVNKKPSEHTFIFIKEKLRCAKTIENKKIVGIYYERYTISPDDDVMIQGMLGRATGYNDNGDSIIYTNIPSIEKYRKLIETHFDDMTIKWVSSSTVIRKGIIKSKQYFNTPDNIKGFKVVQYDNDTETAEEKRERISKEKEEKEQRKIEKAIAKEEKQKLKDEKQKEKEELKEKKKLEKEAKQQEREAMKKAKEALKEQQKKEKEELKEQLKNKKVSSEKKENSKPKKSDVNLDVGRTWMSENESDKSKSSENECDKSGIDISKSKMNFRLKIKKELKTYQDNYRELNNKEIDVEYVNEQIKKICTKFFNDENYEQVIEENGDPKTWENNTFREIINDMSDIFTKYPLENDEDEKNKELENIPEIKHNKKKIKKLQISEDDDE